MVKILSGALVSVCAYAADVVFLAGFAYWTLGPGSGSRLAAPTLPLVLVPCRFADPRCSGIRRVRVVSSGANRPT